MTQKLTVTAVAALFVALAGCKSAGDKCREENRAIYATDIAACKDDACKKKAAVVLKDYLAACDKMK